MWRAPSSHLSVQPAFEATSLQANEFVTSLHVCSASKRAVIRIEATGMAVGRSGSSLFMATTIETQIDLTECWAVVIGASSVTKSAPQFTMVVVGTFAIVKFVGQSFVLAP